MKLVKWFLNLLYFAILLCGMFIVSLGCNFLVSVQTGESDSSFVVYSMSETSYGINDAITFIGDNIKTNYKLYSNSDDINYSSAMFVIEYGENEKPIEISGTDGTYEIDALYLDIKGPKARVSNWFSWEWWSTYPGSWLDYGVDFVASVTSPVVLPSYNAANLAKFYNPDMQPGDPLVLTDELTTDLAKKYGKDYVTRAVQDLYAVQTDSVLPGSAITTYHKWIKAYSHFYDYMFKIAKYNALSKDENGDYYKVYEKYYNKIVVNKDGTDDRRLNSNVNALYYTLLLDALGAGFVIWQYPITTETEDDGKVKVKGGLFRRRHGRKKAGGFFRRKHGEESNK